jgi:hypothetical protein
MPTFWTIDRFEEDEWAVLESDDGESMSVPAYWLPSAAREGQVLRLEHGAEDGPRVEPKSVQLRFSLDEAETERRRAQVEEIRRSLPPGPEGDIDL